MQRGGGGEGGRLWSQWAVPFTSISQSLKQVFAYFTPATDFSVRGGGTLHALLTGYLKHQYLIQAQVNEHSETFIGASAKVRTSQSVSRESIRK